MKKLFLLGLILSFVFVPAIIGATNGNGNDSPSYEMAESGDLEATIYNLANALFLILMAAAVVAILVAGFMFISAGGDPDKMASARNFVIFALVGVIVALLARVLVNWAASLVTD